MTWIDDFREMVFQLPAKEENIERANLLKYKNRPDSIFKYQDVTDDKSISNLEESKVWLSSSRSLNDPYDCAFYIDLEVMLIELIRNPPPNLAADMDMKEKVPADVIAEMKKSRNLQELLIDAGHTHEPIENRKRLKDAVQPIINKALENASHSFSEEVRGRFKICAFSERLDSTLMWSHYAKNHTGFCVEYDIKSLPSDARWSRFLYPVIYSDHLFDATPLYIAGLKREPINEIHRIMPGLFKSKEWSYEKEWRLIFILAVAQTIPAPTPKNVYLGSHIEAKNQQTLIEICARKNIPVQKMKHSSNEFLMVPCSIEEAERKSPKLGT